MPPREQENLLVGEADVIAEDLESRIAQIALQARKRNPLGYKTSPPPSRGASPPATPPRSRTFVNTVSGQEIMLLDTAQNVPAFLEEYW